MAISCMWAWMIPHFYIEFREYRLALEKVDLSEVWNINKNGNGGDEDGDDDDDDTDDDDGSIPRERANRATVRGMVWAILIISITYVGSVLSIGAATALPDPTILTKPVAIAIGVGRMVSACLLAYFSVEIPRWLGIYYSSQNHVDCYSKQLSTKSPPELSFRVCWSVLGRFFVNYPFLIAYFCSESLSHVVLSTGVGIVTGFGVVYFVWLGHAKLDFQNRTRFGILLSLVIACASAIAFSFGCMFVKTVWLDNNEYTGEYFVFTFFVWLALCVLAHVVYYRLTKRKLAEAKASRTAQGDDTVVGDVSEVLSTARREELDMTGDWRYNKQFFQPPKSINCKPFPSLPDLVKMGRKSSLASKQKADRDDTTTTNARNAKERETPCQVPLRLQSSVGFGDDDLTTKRAASGLDRAATEVIEASEKRRTIPDDSSSGDDCCYNGHNSSIVQEDEDDDSQFAGSIEELDVPSLYSMVKHNSCCYRRRHYDAPHRKGWSCWIIVVQWTLWTLACLWHLTFAVVSIGASYQQNKVRAALHATYETLYPANYTSGVMCAWNEASPDADIRSFDSYQDATDAGYSVVHCGGCGSCSNWNDLGLQWTTRDHLAQKAKNCVKKSIFGSREEVQTCNEGTIGFTEECSLCWTEDEYCARDNCMFIYLQSIYTNQVNNFRVGPEDITSATCDEALCGPEFVPCSGATRRRMNIISDIPRPTSQQCEVTSADWSVIFDPL